MSDASKLEIILAARDMTARTLQTFQGRINALTKSVFSLHGGLVGLAGVGGFGALAKGVLDTASSFEQMEIKLNALTNGKGRDTLEAINQWAKDMPVNTMAAVDTFAMMQALGLDPTIDKMQTLVDVSAIFGDDAMPRVARALGQMQTLGKLSAEELNQLSEAGINARKYLSDAFGKSVEELQKSKVSIDQIIQAIWNGLNADYSGSAKAAMGSWRGLVTQFQSNWMELDRIVSDAGLFDELKTQMAGVNGEFTTWLETNQSIIRVKIPEYIEETKDAAASLFSTMQTGMSIYNAIPDEIVGAAGAGIAGRIIFGSWGPAKIVAALSIINDGMSTFNMGMGDLARSYGESVDAIEEFYQALLGNRAGYADDIKNLQAAAATSMRQQQLIPPYITITPGGGSAGGSGVKTGASSYATPSQPYVAGLEQAMLERTQPGYLTTPSIPEWKKGIMAFEGAQMGSTDVFQGMAEANARAMEQMETASVETAGVMKDAFSGWAIGYASTLNDMLWESELTFDGIAESFGKMLTQMLMQSAMADITGSIFGNSSEGGLLKMGLSALTGLFAGGSSTVIASSGATPILPRAGGGPVAPGGTYLVGERGPELLRMGRSGGNVTPNNALGGSTYNIQINTLDPQSWDEFARRNPGAIISVIDDSLKNYGVLNSTIRRTT